MFNPTRILRRTFLLAAALLVTLLPGCSASTGSSPPSQPATSSAPPPIGTYSTPNPGSVNMYWFSAPDGLVLVDGLRTLSDARAALPHIQAAGRPVAGVLVTHPHPDHVGGLAVFHQTFPAAPIWADAASIAFIRDDPLGFYSLTHQQLGDDFPAHGQVPDHVVASNAPVDVGGARIETAEFGTGEAVSAVAYYRPETGELFVGDLVGNHVTPALLEGHTCEWLTQLDQLTARFPTARVLYPGHGAPGAPAELINAQRDYIRAVRALVSPAIADTSPGGSTVTSDEESAIIAELDRRYPNYPRVASLPTLAQLNIQAVGGELRQPATNPLPQACRA